MAFFDAQADDNAHQPLLGLNPAVPAKDDMSLHAAIARKLAERANAPEVEEPEVFSDELFSTASGPVPDLIPKIVKAGRRFNHLDAELYAGLEQYLPTPKIRYGVITRRLRREIALLESRLRQYRRIDNPSADLRESMQTLEVRLSILVQHEQSAAEELNRLNRKGAFVLGTIENGMRAGQWLGRGLRQLANWCRKTVLFGPDAAARREMETLQRRVRALGAVLEEKLADPAVAETEVAELIRRYDQDAAVLEKLTRQWLNREPLMKRLIRRVPVFRL